ncbi:hypothetical protein SAMN05446037_100649 [Anaerovirgula multivorans]|uniref:Uncharacterized protein n=1 Tax=Anaerovirgula multivorans TaxID=312168 RepID=A0A239CMB8_9FIRM|nr:hypothetical protein [Anaerovirgula multivorans]SNS21287.1 hypothetical protein SAMN05446037_100649 [Anaerovirgula multivorans]
MNKGCAKCDYKEACRKSVRTSEGLVPAKSQTQVSMKCVCTVMPICKKCKLFKSRKCAYWKILNGKQQQLGEVVVCPKKDKLAKA